MGWPRHNSTADISKKAVDCEFFNTGGISSEFFGWTAKTTNMGTAIRQMSFSTFIFGVEDTIQKSSDHLFCSSIGCDVMDQGSGDG